VRSFFIFHFLRWYPSWLGWLPRQVPRLTLAQATDLAEKRDQREKTGDNGATQTTEAA
jgi:cardiolipin synthase